MSRKSLLSRVPKRQYSDRAPILRDLKQLADLVLKEPADPACAKPLADGLEHHVCRNNSAVHAVPGLAAGHEVVDVSGADDQDDGSLGDKFLPLADVLEHGAGLGVLDADDAGGKSVAGGGCDTPGLDHTLDLFVLYGLVSPATDAASLVQFGDDSFHLYLYVTNFVFCLFFSFFLFLLFFFFMFLSFSPYFGKFLIQLKQCFQILKKRLHFRSIFNQPIQFNLRCHRN